MERTLKNNKKAWPEKESASTENQSLLTICQVFNKLHHRIESFPFTIGNFEGAHLKISEDLSLKGEFLIVLSKNDEYCVEDIGGNCYIEHKI